MKIEKYQILPTIQCRIIWATIQLYSILRHFFGILVPQVVWTKCECRAEQSELNAKLLVVSRIPFPPGPSSSLEPSLSGLMLAARRSSRALIFCGSLFARWTCFKVGVRRAHLRGPRNLMLLLLHAACDMRAVCREAGNRFAPKLGQMRPRSNSATKCCYMLVIVTKEKCHNNRWPHSWKFAIYKNLFILCSIPVCLNCYIWRLIRDT